MVLRSTMSILSAMKRGVGAPDGGGARPIRTFHAYGADVIGTVEGRKPILSKLAEDSTARDTFDGGLVFTSLSVCVHARYASKLGVRKCRHGLAALVINDYAAGYSMN